MLVEQSWIVSFKFFNQLIQLTQCRHRFHNFGTLNRVTFKFLETCERLIDTNTDSTLHMRNSGIHDK